jgi:KEOPS complex subunit Pcc1
VKAKAAVRLPFKSEKQLRSMLDALAPEVKRQVGIRSKATLKAEEQTLVLEIEADDTVALRAALNTYLRWINSALNVLETMELRR